MYSAAFLPKRCHIHSYVIHIVMDVAIYLKESMGGARGESGRQSRRGWRAGDAGMAYETEAARGTLKLLTASAKAGEYISSQKAQSDAPFLLGDGVSGSWRSSST